MEGHSLVANGVVARSRRTLLQYESVEMSSIKSVHGGPAVKTGTHVRGLPLLTRDLDESRDEAMIAVPMDRWRKAQHGDAHASRSHRHCCLFRLARKTGIGNILFRCERALALNEQGPGSDDQRTLGTREGGSKCIDSEPIL